LNVVWKAEIPDPRGADNPTGVWAGYDQQIATWNGSSWAFQEPKADWIAFVSSEQKLYYYDSVEWVRLSAGTDDVVIGLNANNDLHVIGIDHIITDTGISIDPSFTPMSNPSRELVTRAFVEAASGKVDDQTISKIVNKGSFITGTDFSDVLRAWNPSGPNGVIAQGIMYNEGIMYMATSTSGIVSISSGSQYDFSNGVTKDFYLYATKNLLPFNLYIGGDGNTNPSEKYYFDYVNFESY